jgi:hypothetical protein
LYLHLGSDRQRLEPALYEVGVADVGPALVGEDEIIALAVAGSQPPSLQRGYQINAERDLANPGRRLRRVCRR